MLNQNLHILFIILENLYLHLSSYSIADFHLGTVIEIIKAQNYSLICLLELMLINFM